MWYFRPRLPQFPPCSFREFERVNQSLTHRGPDAEGYFIDSSIWLGHKRLSVIDLAGGKQPMRSNAGSAIVTYNGEIYNFKQLRQNLEIRGHRFQTQSDTEVLLEMYEELGPTFVNDLRGMFALGIWDFQSSSLLLARDGFGIKPLFYAQGDGWLAFASELQAMLTFPMVSRTIDPDALNYYLTYDSVPAPHSLIRSIRKVAAGEVVTWKGGRLEYTSMSWPQYPAARSEPLSRDAVRTTLEDSIEQHLVSDVPVGVFLSGGLDSSYIAAVVARRVKNLRTFSISFTESTFDESKYSQTVATHLGTSHTEIQLTPDRAYSLLLDSPNFFDEPIGDPAILPMYLLAEEARKSVTVALSGEGADELFLGYPTYHAHRYVKLYQSLPKSLQVILRSIVAKLPTSDRNFAIDFVLRRFLAGADHLCIPRHVLWMSALPPSKLDLFTSQYASQVTDPGGLAPAYLKLPNESSLPDIIRASLLDLKLYLQDGILMRTDKVSMKHSLEVRVPFLDREVAAMAWQLPVQSKLGLLYGKHILREIASEYLPRSIVWRKKKGFGVPVAAWLRGPFHELSLELLSEEYLVRQGIFDPKAITRLLTEHLAGKENHRKALWVVIIFQLWHQKWCR